MYTLVLNEKGECEVVWCTANETFYLDNKTTSPYAVHISLVVLDCSLSKVKRRLSVLIKKECM